MSKSRTKKDGVVRNPGNSSDKSALRWCNVFLSDEHQAILAEQQIDLDAISVQFVGLALTYEGGISLKRLEDGNVMAAVIFSDPHVEGGNVGISAFATIHADAISALLFKWFDVLDETIPEPSTGGTRRFR